MRTNIYEEIMMLCFLVGFFLFAFAKEKTELKEYEALRNSSWRMAIVLNTAMLACSIMFIYGKGFVAVILLNMVSVFIFYIVVFTIKKTKLKSAGKERHNQHG
jgi:amino acid transporter